MNKKISLISISLLMLVMLLPVGLSFASKPEEVILVMFLSAEVTSSKNVGMNVISERVLDGSFTEGPIVGDITREIRVVQHTETGKMTVQNTVYVDNAVVNVDGIEAEGSFVMNVMGMAGNAKWTIISSDLTSDGEQVRLHGQGTAVITYFGFTTFPTHYDIENTLSGQINITP